MAGQNQEHLTPNGNNQAHLPDMTIKPAYVSPVQASSSASKINIPETISPTDILQDSLNKSIANSQDEYAYTKQYAFNPETTQRQSQNFERYYSHGGYEKLGFTPWGDNEANYNAQTSGWSDLARATIQGAKLTGVGFMSPLKSYADILTGNPLALDFDSSRDMAHYNMVGSSSRGGVAGFASNLVVNSGYTVGIVGEMFLEEAALALAAPETAGATVPLMGLRVAKTFENIGKFYTATKGIVKGVNTLKDFNIAKTAFNSFKSVGKFINPLENTVEAVSALNKSKSLTSLAAIAPTAGAFYRDVRAANLTLSEAKMEGAGVTDEVKQTLLDDFYKNNNRMPSDLEMKEINQTALDAGNSTMYANVPTIFLTNKVTFDGPLLKGFKPIVEDISIRGLKTVFKKGVGFTLEESGLKAVGKSLISPKTYGKAALKYFKGNLMEGVQESSQEIISGTAKDYYTDLYKNKGKQGLDFSLGTYLNDNLQKQFSGQGFETFASGFFMGGLIGGGSVAFNAIGNRVSPPKGFKNYSEYKAKTREAAQMAVDKLNEMYKNPVDFLGSKVLNYAKTIQAQEGKKQAELNNDNKSWQDFDDVETFGHIHTALETGTLPIFLDQIKDLQKMDNEGLKDAFGLEAQEVRDRLDKITQRTERIQESYNYWQEKAPNPFNPKQYPEGSEENIDAQIHYKAWEAAKQQAVAYNYSIERSSARMEALVQQLASENPVKNALSSDFTVLASASSMKGELLQLNQEIKALSPNATTAQDKKHVKNKQAKFDTLSEFSDAHAEYLKTPTEATTKKLKKAYVKYLKAINTSDTTLSDAAVEQSFVKLKDSLDLGQDVDAAQTALNLLSNPEGFKNHYTALAGTLKELFESRDKLNKESVADGQKKTEDNTILNVLNSRGLRLSPKAIEQLLEQHILPEELEDIASKEIVTKGHPRYEEVRGAMENYIQAQNKEEDDITDADLEFVKAEKDIRVSVKNKIVEKLKANKKLSVREQEVYNLLKEELDARVAEPVAEEPVVAEEEIIDDSKEQEENASNAINALQKAKNIGEIEKIYNDLNSKTTIDPEYLSVNGITQIESLYHKLREGLRNSVSFEEIVVGDVLMTEAGEKWIVDEIFSDHILTSDVTGIDFLRMNKENFKTNIIQKINMDTKAESAGSTLTPEQAKNSDMSLENRERVLTDARTEIEQLKNAKTRKELEQDFINDLGCK